MAVDVIVVDDDPATGELSRDLIERAGFKVLLLEHSEDLLPSLAERRPRALVLDMMMPGLDGMELLRAIKTNPATAHIKVALVTAKAFSVERQRAYNLGADLFLGKPYDIKAFAFSISSLLKPPEQSSRSEQSSRPEPPRSGDALSGLRCKVRVWGCRGFSPYLANERSRYGRQTSCVSVQTPYGIFILDAGSGIIPLGLALVKTLKASAKELWLLLSHFHLDHVMGLGGFPCAHDSEFKIQIASANDGGKDINELLQEVFSGALTSFYPPPKAKVTGYRLAEGSYELTPGVVLHTLHMNHPTTTMGFRLEVAGKKIIYCPDNELSSPGAGGFPSLDDKLVRFCEGADLLIHDARYTDEDYEKHRHQGHSGLSSTLELAGAKAKVKELVLFHLDPGYSDEALDGMLEKAQSIVLQRGWPMRCHIASEGLTLDV